MLCVCSVCASSNWSSTICSFPPLVRGVRDFLNHEHRVFNSEEFLRTRYPADQLFYKKVRSHLRIRTCRRTEKLWLAALHVSHCYCCPQVLDTHVFHSFLRDRLNKKWDAFSRMEQSTSDYAHRYDGVLERQRGSSLVEYLSYSYFCSTTQIAFHSAFQSFFYNPYDVFHSGNTLNELHC